MQRQREPGQRLVITGRPAAAGDEQRTAGGQLAAFGPRQHEVDRGRRGMGVRRDTTRSPGSGTAGPGSGCSDRRVERLYSPITVIRLPPPGVQKSGESVVPALGNRIDVGRGVLVVEHAEIRLEQQRGWRLELGPRRRDLVVLVQARPEIDPVARRGFVIAVERELLPWPEGEPGECRHCGAARRRRSGPIWLRFPARTVASPRR